MLSGLIYMLSMFYKYVYERHRFKCTSFIYVTRQMDTLPSVRVNNVNEQQQH